MSASSTARGVPEEIIFRKELELLGGHMPGLSLGFMIEERSSREGWYGHMGRIDAIRLPLLAPDFREREIFCCGPDPFMRAVRGMLEAAGFDMARYHQESFAAPAVEEIPAPFAVLADGGTGVPAEAVTPIRFALSDVDAECVAGQTVLQTARASGVQDSRGLRIRPVRNLQGEEGLRRRRDEPQWRHSRSRDR